MHASAISPSCSMRPSLSWSNIPPAPKCPRPRLRSHLPSIRASCLPPIHFKTIQPISKQPLCPLTVSNRMPPGNTDDQQQGRPRNTRADLALCDRSTLGMRVTTSILPVNRASHLAIYTWLAHAAIHLSFTSRRRSQHPHMQNRPRPLSRARQVSLRLVSCGRGQGPEKCAYSTVSGTVIARRTIMTTAQP